MAGFPSSRDLVRRAVEFTLDRRLLDNRFRSILVEAMVAAALEPAWEWTAGDWAGWDFKHRETGVLLEVKQSAARQSWHKAEDTPSKPVFDIALRKGYYVGNQFIANDAGQRYAQIYIFAHHPLMGDGADHRQPEQWRFIVIDEANLPSPPARTVTWATLAKLEPEAVDFTGLRAAVERVREALPDVRAVRQVPMLDRWAGDEDNGGLPIEVLKPGD